MRDEEALLNSYSETTGLASRSGQAEQASTHLLRDVTLQRQRWVGWGEWVGGAIGRLRHFKSPDDWVRDDGRTLCSRMKQGLHLCLAPLCVFPKVDKSKKKA